jgi:hypothetical protein
MFGLLIAMWPNHPNYEAWLHKYIELSVAATARLADVTSSEIRNGRPLNEWLKGSNYENDGTLVNHNIYPHINYMLQGAQNRLQGILTLALANYPIPEASLFNADVIFNAYSNLNFPYPPYTSPGGTIYMPDTYQVFDPSDQADVGLMRYYLYGAFDASANLFGFDNLSSEERKGSYWEFLHAGQALVMQERHSDGHMFEQGEDSPGSEETAAYHIALIYLGYWRKNQGAWTISNESFDCTQNPCAVKDDYRVPSNRTATLSPLDNDITWNLAVSIVGFSQGGHGTVTKIVEEGEDKLIYTPEDGYLGEDLITYTLQFANHVISTNTIDLSVYPAAKVLWLTANTVNDLRDGTPIEIWPDISGQAHHAIRTGTDSAPIFRSSVEGKAAIEFTGSQSLTIGDLSTYDEDWTIFVIGRLSGFSNNKYLLNLNNRAALLFGGPTSSNSKFGYLTWNRSANSFTLSNLSTNTWYVTYARRNGLEFTAGATGDVTEGRQVVDYALPLSKLILGKRLHWNATTNTLVNYFFKGEINTLLIYNYSLTDDEIQQVAMNLSQPYQTPTITATQTPTPTHTSTSTLVAATFTPTTTYTSTSTVTPFYTPTSTNTSTSTFTSTPLYNPNKVYLPLVSKNPTVSQGFNPVTGFQSWLQGVLARLFKQH